MQKDEAHNLEQVAEAALLTLGAVLEWKPLKAGYEPSPGFVWDVARLRVARRSYTVQLDLTRAPQAYAEAYDWPLDGIQIHKKKSEKAVKHWYNTVGEAKAACEVHAATGQFPPSVESA